RLAMTVNGIPRPLQEFRSEYTDAYAQSKGVRQIIAWLEHLHQLTSQEAKGITQGIAYGRYLQCLKQQPGELPDSPHIALLFVTNASSMYEAAAEVSDKVIAPFFEKFGYFPYFLPWTQEELQYAKNNQTETLRSVFRSTSVQFFP
ncbi:MAG: hypothetical protein AAB403_21985, partial [Planctomycetota bacterium]